MVTSNPVAEEGGDPLDAEDPYAMAGAVKDGSVTVTLGGVAEDNTARIGLPPVSR